MHSLKQRVGLIEILLNPKVLKLDVIIYLYCSLFIYDIMLLLYCIHTIIIHYLFSYYSFP